MALINDGSQALKEEIQESYLRVKAAKHGMKLEDLVPKHDIQFYLPNKLNYVKPKDYQKASHKYAQSTKHGGEDTKISNTFLTSLNHSQVITRDAQGIKSVERSMQATKKPQNLLNISHAGHQKTKSVNFTSPKLPGTTKNSLQKLRNSVFQNTGHTLTKTPQSAIKSPIKSPLSPEAPNRLNAITQKFNRDQNLSQVDQRRKIRLVSLIDSKPINHYINLLTLKEFSKREQDVGGLAGSLQATAGLKEKEHQKNRDVAKILREDLNQQYDDKIGRLYELRKGERTQAEPRHEIKNLETVSQADSVDTHLQGNSRRISRKNRDLSNVGITESDSNRIKELLNPDFAKEIEDSIKKQILELHDYHHRQDDDPRDNENGVDNKIESEEQAKRIAQLRRDQELAEFEEKGGLARILDNLFNPKDQSIELDSVYQLKQLCKSYYETKSKISKDLIETLDALLNERPHAIAMKKKGFYGETDETQKDDT